MYVSILGSASDVGRAVRPQCLTLAQDYRLAPLPASPSSPSTYYHATPFTTKSLVPSIDSLLSRGLDHPPTNACSRKSVVAYAHTSPHSCLCFYRARPNNTIRYVSVQLGRANRVRRKLVSDFYIVCLPRIDFSSCFGVTMFIIY